MIVKSVQLFDLKSFKEAKLELSPGINLLVGPNNSGKSTIIKSLLNLQYTPFSSTDIRARKRTAKIFYDLVDVSEEDNFSFIDPKRPDDFEFGEAFKIIWGLLITPSSTKEEFHLADLKNKIALLPNRTIKVTDRKGREVRLKMFDRFSDRENEMNFIYPFLAKRKNEYQEYNINHEQTYRVEQGLRNLAAKIQKIGNPSHPRSAEFQEYTEKIIGFRIGVIPTNQQNVSGIEPGIYVTDDYMIPIKSMGEGIANIVGFIVTLLSSDNKLFLIEELENDIHPAALKSLLELIKLKSNRNQFVISTHSHIVVKLLGGIKGSKIFYFDWQPFEDIDGSKINIPTSSVSEVSTSTEARLDVLKKLGYDYVDYELYEGYIFFEESSAETVIKDFLIPNFVPALYSKVKTIGARGVDDLEVRVVDFNRLFVFVHTSPVYKNKAWVIADGDQAGKEIIQSLKETFETWPAEHFLNFSAEDFESYYPKRFKKDVQALSKLSRKKLKEAKVTLLLKVMDWAFKNHEQAVEEFGESASEVIDILKNINRSLK